MNCIRLARLEHTDTHSGYQRCSPLCSAIMQTFFLSFRHTHKNYRVNVTRARCEPRSATDRQATSTAAFVACERLKCVSRCTTHTTLSLGSTLCSWHIINMMKKNKRNNAFAICMLKRDKTALIINAASRARWLAVLRCNLSRRRSPPPPFRSFSITCYRRAHLFVVPAVVRICLCV